MNQDEFLSLAAEARARIAPYVERTPTVKLADGIWLKREDLQCMGSFKARGVLNCVLRADSSTLGRGLVTVSTGNTALAVIAVAESLGLDAVIFMPMHASEHKVQRARRAGGHVFVSGRTFSDSQEEAQAFSSEHSMMFISPGSDYHFLAGVSSIGFEIIEDLPSVQTIYVPVGGGGLITGIGLILKSLADPPRIVGVQAERSPIVYELFHFGGQKSQPQSTIADCLAGDLEKGAPIRELMHEVMDDIVLASESELEQAVVLLRARSVIAEPSGAASVVAAIRNSLSPTACAVVTGASQ